MSTPTPNPAPAVAQYHNQNGHFDSVYGPDAASRAARLDAVCRAIRRRAISEDEVISAQDAAMAASLEKLWGCDEMTVNGVMYRTRDEAARVRRVLREAGIPHHYPGTREARAALALARGGKASNPATEKFPGLAPGSTISAGI